MTAFSVQFQKDWSIRRQLKLRQRPTGEWEVFTTIHGTDSFRWFIISDSKAKWYKEHFRDIPVVPFEGD